MTATATTKPLLRLSTVANGCPRQAVYSATGAPARDRLPEEDGYLYRGVEIERGYVKRLVDAERAAGRKASIWVMSGPDDWLPSGYRARTPEQATHIVQVKVPWQQGFGHIDLFVPETGTVVEVLSSAAPTEEYKRGKLRQACAYAEYYEPAQNIALVVVSPSDYSEERTVVVKSSRLYHELLDELRERLLAVDTWANDGTLPGRVCSKPSDGRNYFCAHTAHCFQDWVPPPLEQIAADADLVDAVADFDQARTRLAELAVSVRIIEADKKAAQAVIEAADLPAGVDVQVGPYAVTRTSVQRKETFDWSKAEAAGVFEPGLYGDYFKPGASYSTFKTARVLEPNAEDFGDEAPW